MNARGSTPRALFCLSLCPLIRGLEVRSRMWINIGNPRFSLRPLTIADSGRLEP